MSSDSLLSNNGHLWTDAESWQFYQCMLTARIPIPFSVTALRHRWLAVCSSVSVIIYRSIHWPCDKVYLDNRCRYTFIAFDILAIIRYMHLKATSVISNFTTFSFFFFGGQLFFSYISIRRKKKWNLTFTSRNMGTFLYSIKKKLMPITLLYLSTDASIVFDTIDN